MTQGVSILPGHLSELELELDAALARIADIDLPIATLWDPWKCPLNVLPYLAWALSVDQWQSSWPEQIKRQVVASSLSVHRRKGTRPAVEQALAALGVETEFTEWCEATPMATPGTFELIAWVNENLTEGEETFLNQTLYHQIQAEVTNAKNARSHFTFQIGAKFGPNDFGLASAVSGIGALARRDTQAIQPPLETSAGVGVASSAESVSLTRQTAQVSVDAQPKPCGLMSAAVCQGWAVVYKRMEAIT